MYDYERSACILGRKKYMRMTDRGASPFMIAFDQTYYSSAVTVEFWVYPEIVTGTVNVYSHAGFFTVGMKLGTTAFQTYGSGGSCSIAVTYAKNTWIHFSHVIDRTNSLAYVIPGGRLNRV